MSQFRPTPETGCSSVQRIYYTQSVTSNHLLWKQLVILLHRARLQYPFMAIMSTTLHTLAADVILAHSTPVQWALSLVSGSVRVLCVCTAAASTAGDDITATAHRLRVSCVSTLLVGGIQTVHGHGRTWTEVSGFQWHWTETCGSRVQDRGSGGWRWERDIKNSNRTNRFCTELLHIVLESGHAASPGTHRLDGMRRRWGDHARGHCNTFTVIYTSHSWYINSRHTQRVRCRVTRWYTGRVGHRLSGFPRCTASRVSLHLSSWLALWDCKIVSRLSLMYAIWNWSVFVNNVPNDNQKCLSLRHTAINNPSQWLKLMYIKGNDNIIYHSNPFWAKFELSQTWHNYTLGRYFMWI